MIGFISAAFLALASLADAAPQGKLSVLSTGGPVKPNSYIIALKSEDVFDKHMDWINAQVKKYNNSKVTSQFNAADQGFIAYSVVLDPADHAISMDDGSIMTASNGSPISILDAVLSRSDIKFIEEDGIMRITGTQNDAPWGLQRISGSQPLPPGSDPNSPAYTYTFNETAGQGVDVYVIDTGINTEHESFEGRAKFAFAAEGQQQEDDQGHGTHCAGTIGSRDFGVAKAANLIAVLGADGSGSISGIISGVEFAMQTAASSGRPSVISMSLGGAVSEALDQAATAAVGRGIHVVVAAGNDGADTDGSSPARAPAVFTVGATSIDDQVASFSNIGQAIDIFAPGDKVLSTFIGSTTATKVLSGTSMACPHVSGMVAAILSQEGNMTPAQMAERLKSLGQADALSNVPAGTINLVAQLGSGSQPQRPDNGTVCYPRP
ncbi:unnamed protein product [Rhizoctonia solani]|uniref:Peptidase S8/S53 domain-containing protein n=1 Tax=Rhizoctonia solani TaxID=456999 RepID=A0A8H3CTA0_9AGAM|nr:unnamed protein product [Rhizoctonia solani]